MADGIDRINTYVLMNHTESDLRFLGGWRVWLPPSQGYGGLWGGEDEIPMTKRQAPIHKNLVRYTSSSRWIWPICFLVALGINGCDYGKINSHVISAEANTTPVLQVRLNDQVLNIKLSNFGKTVIRVDRELVFLLDVFPVSPDGTALPLDEVRATPRIDAAAVASRFTLLQPGESIERRLILTEPFKVFTCGIGYPSHRVIIAHEGFYVFPRNKMIAEIDVWYGNLSGMPECLHTYVGKDRVPADLYQGPFRESVTVEK